MSFIIRNIAGIPIEINDLGIRLEIGEDISLAEEAAKDIAISDDLISAIQATNLIVLDPLDGVNPLTILQSVEAIQVANDTHFRIRGGELSQLDDVSGTVPPDGYVLTYNQITSLWEPAPGGGGGGGDSSSVRETINQLAHGFTTGTPIYFDGTNWQTAKADNVNTLGTAVADVASTDIFDAVTDGDIIGMTGLTAGSWYYVSDSTAGTLTAMEPTSTYSNPIGFAEAATKLHVQSIRASDLTAGQDTVPKKIINQVGHGFATGTPVYFDGSVWQPAQANSINTLATEIAVVIDIDNFEAIVIGTIMGLVGLVPGTWYYVSDSVAGDLVTTEPTISNPMGIAETSSTLFVIPMRAVDYTNA